MIYVQMTYSPSYHHCHFLEYREYIFIARVILLLWSAACLNRQFKFLLFTVIEMAVSLRGGGCESNRGWMSVGPLLLLQ